MNKELRIFDTMSLVEVQGLTVVNNNQATFAKVANSLDLLDKTAEQAHNIRNEFVKKFYEIFAGQKDRLEEMTILSYVTAVIDYYLTTLPDGYDYI
jgi:hypothetical protein